MRLGDIPDGATNLLYVDDGHGNDVFVGMTLPNESRNSVIRKWLESTKPIVKLAADDLVNYNVNRYWQRPLGLEAWDLSAFSNAVGYASPDRVATNSEGRTLYRKVAVYESEGRKVLLYALRMF